MTTHGDHDHVPTTKSLAAVFLANASRHVTTPDNDWFVGYNQHKAAQLLDAIVDLILAEVKIESWHADLGTLGCTEGTCQSSIQET